MSFLYFINLEESLWKRKLFLLDKTATLQESINVSRGELPRVTAVMEVPCPGMSLKDVKQLGPSPMFSFVI